MAGFAAWDDFYAALNAHRQAVTRHFQAVFAEPGAESDARGPGRIIRASRRCARSQRYLQLPEDSRRRFDALMPALAQRRGRDTRSGGDAGARRRPAGGDRAARRLPCAARRAARGARARDAHDRRLELGGRVRHPASAAARRAARRPGAVCRRRTGASSSASLRAALAAAGGDVERQMNAVREQHQSQLFRLLAQDLAGLLTVEVLADHLSQLADIVLQVRPGSLLGAGRDAPPRAAALRRDRLRQARRQGARLRLRPRHHLPLRRRRRARGGELRAPRAALQQLAQRAHLGRRPVRDRPALRPSGAERPAGVLARRASRNTRSTRPGPGSTRRSRARASAPATGMSALPSRPSGRASCNARAGSRRARARGARDARRSCTPRTRTARACST